MSESHRDYDKSSSHNHRTSDISRKRSHLDVDDVDAKVYVGNLPTEKITDDELLNFFKVYGKVSDIRVYKNHIFVQYLRSDDAKRLIKEGQVSLTFKGNKLEILSARDVRSTSTNSDRPSRERITHRTSSSTYEPTRKRFPTFSSSTEKPSRTLSRSDSRSLPYTILSGSKNADEYVDCQIIIVNIRQREYAEQIESRLSSRGMKTSIIILREDYSLTQAIENAARLQCLYGIIAMPMHEDRHTASFHILYGQTEEHRNLTLEDGIHIIITNYLAYKESLRQNTANESAMSSYEYQKHEANNHVQEEITPPVLSLNDKLPLSMLLCLLADGRQLTLEEIDRVLVYLLEKKSKMLTLPAGTLPPLPAQYATVNAFNHSSSDTTAEVSSTIAEQIRQMLTTNIVKSNASIIDSNLDKLPDIVKMENTSIQSKASIQEQSTAQTGLAFPQSDTLPIVIPPFNYTTPVSSTTPNFSSFNAALKATTPVNIPNFVSQTSQYFYPIPPPPPPANMFQSTLNTTAVETTAAILQAYSQFNVQPTATSSIINQQQQQTRK